MGMETTGGTKLVVGRRYRVDFDDCCVAGWFEAELVDLEDDGEYLIVAHFDNGVRLAKLFGVDFLDIT